MSNGKPIKLTEAKAADICRGGGLSKEAVQLQKEGQAALAYLEVLIANEKFPDAARFLASGLPKREAIWWACKCVRQVSPEKMQAQQEAALQSAEKWATSPSEEARRAAWTAAEAADFGTPAGCAALAAFWSEGSLAPPNIGVVPPGETLTAQAVAGALGLAAVMSEPEKAGEKFRKFFALGIEIAQKGEPWKK
jgi:hypothetical protein